MYESIVQGDDTHKSLSGQLTGLVLPTIEAGKKYRWALSLNAAQDTLLKLLYPVPGNSHRYIHEKIDSLYDAILAEHSKNIDPEIIDRSIKFGISIAVAIYNWSLADGGNKGYTRNFDPSYVFPGVIHTGRHQLEGKPSAFIHCILIGGTIELSYLQMEACLFLPLFLIPLILIPIIINCTRRFMTRTKY